MMKHRIKSLVSLLLILTVLSITLAGCGTEESAQPGSLAIVVAATSCKLENNFSNEDLQDKVTATIESYGTVSIISADSKPELVMAENYDIEDQYKQADKAKLHKNAVNKSYSVLYKLESVKANDPELDTLKALSMAVRALSSEAGDGDRTIIIYDTGLSTSGKINFLNNILYANPEVIAERLDAINAIPDFSGITVEWYQLGDVAYPQEEVSDPSKLEAIWRAIIEKTGGTANFSDRLANPKEVDYQQYPKMSTVNIPPDADIEFDPTQATLFTADQIQFQGDTAIYIDSKAVEDTLNPVADYMKSHPEFKGLLVGCTASSDNKQFCLDLSKRRATTVQDTLVSMGVPSSQLQVLGMGSSDPWFIPDKNSDGTYIEEFASQNRKVVLLPADSTEALSILD